MLARDLGMTVGELSERMSHRELVRWRALYLVEAEERLREQERRGRR